MSNKFFSLGLHSHIPYVLAHGSWPHGMDWLYEAAAETYMPLLDVFERLAGEGVAARADVRVRRGPGHITPAFRSLQDRGYIEVLTSAATHGYFPLLARDESVRQQVRQGRYTYRKYFGREARGFWIPECAYRPGDNWQSPVED